MELEQLARTAIVENAHAPCRLDLRVVTEETTMNPTAMPPMELYVDLNP